MTTTDYVINAVLVFLVLRQARERQLDRRSVLVPVVLVCLAAEHYLRGVPTAGSDLVLVLGLIALGATLGVLGGLVTRVRVDTRGVARARVGWLAGGLLISGIGSRMAFVYAVQHGAGPTIARFSVAHQITGANAWAAALVLMALCEVIVRLVTVHARAHRLTTRTPIEIPAGVVA
jgi:hypothetical protein